MQGVKPGTKTSGGNRVTITNPGKILFPAISLTKRELVDYYKFIWPYMKPYVQGRPVSLERFPDGIESNNFYQKDTPPYYPDFIERIAVKDKKKIIHYALISNKESLLYFANMASIPIHLWQSRAEKPEYPDQFILDLDPSDADFNKVKIGARLVKYMMEELELQPYVKTTGSKGLHITVPIIPAYKYDVVKQFTKDIASFMVKNIPDLFTLEMRKNKREGKIFFDYLRNQYGHTAVAPYSVRALPDASLAIPVNWEEIDDENFHPQQFTIRNIKERMRIEGDVWKGIYDAPNDITPAIKKIKKLLKK